MTDSAEAPISAIITDKDGNANFVCTDLVGEKIEKSNATLTIKEWNPTKKVFVVHVEWKPQP